MITSQLIWKFITINLFYLPSVCNLPKVELRLESTEYIIGEDIGENQFALQVCAFSLDVLFGVTATMNISSGTAEGVYYDYHE